MHVLLEIVGIMYSMISRDDYAMHTVYKLYNPQLFALCTQTHNVWVNRDIYIPI